jgi:hypothetical protein
LERAGSLPSVFYWRVERLIFFSDQSDNHLLDYFRGLRVRCPKAALEVEPTSKSMANRPSVEGAENLLGGQK